MNVEQGTPNEEVLKVPYSFDVPCSLFDSCLTVKLPRWQPSFWPDHFELLLGRPARSNPY